MAGYLLQSRADNTVKKYKCAFDQFVKFCDSNELTAKPAIAIAVAMYITHLLLLLLLLLLFYINFWHFIATYELFVLFYSFVLNSCTLSHVATLRMRKILIP